MIKQPSPSMKPINHWGLGISCRAKKGLGTGQTLGKAFLSSSDEPVLRLAL